MLVEAKGSTPQKAGAKAVFLPDGRVIGTLGGGCLEAETRAKALRALDTGAIQLVDAVLNDDFGWDDGLICGGSVRIFIQPNPHLEPAFEPPASRDRRVLATNLRDGTRRLLAEPDPRLRLEGDIFYEPVLPSPVLLVCGGGHIGVALAKLAAWAGFEVTVMDDRADYANRQRFPGAQTIIAEDPGTAIRRCAVDADTYVVLVTRGHRHDALILREVIHSPAAYIGMIGSKRKLRTIMDGFVKEGIATPDDFRRVHSPMGVPIGSATVEEIALSVVAELVAVRRGDRRAGTLSATGALADEFDRAKDRPARGR